MTTPRTLIVGLDGATFDLINPMIEAGDLPNMARLVEQGAHGTLQTWPNTNSAAAWSSMITGYNAGQHGIYHFSEALHRRDAGSSYVPVTAADRRKDPFWRMLSAAGQRVGVINVPISYPADAVNGFMIAGMDAPGTESRGFTHPAGLLDKLNKHDINYIIDVPSLQAASQRNPHHLPEAVTRMIDARSRAILHLMQSSEWDALMAVFVATDRVQHYFWPQDLSRVENPDWIPIRKVYRQIDEFFGKALSIAGDDTTVLVVSDHGFGPMRLGRRCLNQIFAELGLLSFRQGKKSIKGRLLRKMLLTGRRVLPYRIQDRLARRMPGLHLRAVNENSYPSVDWAATRVYTDSHGGRIWINLEGRDTDGIVPKNEYEDTREQVREIISKLTDISTGRPAVQAVHRREDVYSGPFAEKAADLHVEWTAEPLSEGLAYNGGGRLIEARPDNKGRTNKWTGSHRPPGVFIASGPHIKQGASVANAVIYDIAPTVLYLQGLPVPKDSDGKALTHIFSEEWLAAHPVEWSDPTSSSAQQQGSRLSDEDSRRLEERLRGLGYIE